MFTYIISGAVIFVGLMIVIGIGSAVIGFTGGIISGIISRFRN